MGPAATVTLHPSSTNILGIWLLAARAKLPVAERFISRKAVIHGSPQNLKIIKSPIGGIPIIRPQLGQFVSSSKELKPASNRDEAAVQPIFFF